MEMTITSRAIEAASIRKLNNAASALVLQWILQNMLIKKRRL